MRGTKVQNLQDAPTGDVRAAHRRLRAVRGRGPRACYRWLGKTLAVLTDGEFARAGCPRLAGAAARRECEAGARRMDEPLVTFS